MKLGKPRKINAYHSMGSRCITSILSSMMMCCSQLKSDRNTISIDKYCICGEEETVSITSLSVANIQILQLHF